MTHKFSHNLRSRRQSAGHIPLSPLARVPSTSTSLLADVTANQSLEQVEDDVPKTCCNSDAREFPTPASSKILSILKVKTQRLTVLNHGEVYCNNVLHIICKLCAGILYINLCFQTVANLWTVYRFPSETRLSQKIGNIVCSCDSCYTLLTTNLSNVSLQVKPKNKTKHQKGHKHWGVKSSASMNNCIFCSKHVFLVYVYHRYCIVFLHIFRGIPQWLRV